jgi:PAS domain-containing protein
MVTVSAVRSTDDAQPMLMLVHEDITEQYSNTRWQTLESTVATSLAQAPDTAAALQAVLAAVCEARHWDCGQYFEHDVASASLGHVAQWSSARASEVEQFLARSPIGRFRADAGLAGRVCRAKQPVWLRDAHKDVRHGAALPHEVGLRGLFICPVGIDGALDGVLVFGSRAELTELDEHGLRAIASIGKLLGHFLRRETEKRRLLDSEQRYRRYTALACDWQWQLDSELRFVAGTACSIDAGGELIGKRLWELPQLRVAADEWTRLQAEINAQWSFCDFECVVVQKDGRESRYTLSGEPMFDAAGLFCGVLGVGLDITQRAR